MKRFLIRFRQFGDGLFAYFSHVFAVYPTTEIIVKNELLLLLSHRAGDVLVHDVRNKELRKAAGVDDLLSGLFNVLHEIGERVADTVFIRDLLKIVSSEAFQEKGVLHRDLPFVRCKTITVDLLHLTGERSLRNMKDAVKMQPLLLRRALPHADIPPLFSVREVRERGAQLFLEALLGMQLSVIGQRCNLILWILMEKI